MTDEEYVRSVWKTVKESEYDPHEGYTIPQTRVDFGSNHYIEIKARDAWSKAAAFTRERLEQIRQVEEEISAVEHEYKRATVCGVAMSGPSGKSLIWLRILAREQAALTELKRGMK